MDRQCATCAYRGSFVAAPDFIKTAYGDFIAKARAEDNDPAYTGHRCHERDDLKCVGCARWTQEMEAAASAPTQETTQTS